MDTITVNGVRLAYQEAGDGPPVVFVHGSWSDRHAWALVAPPLADRRRVITYDRRGHTDSGRPPGRQPLATHVDDLAALIAGLDAAPAHIVANSLGGELALKLVVARPELVASLCLHEPVLYSVLGDDPRLHGMLADLRVREHRVAAEIRAGRHEAGARLFIETMIMGPGAWAQLPDQLRRTMIHNAPTFPDELDDLAAATIDPADLARITAPALLTGGALTPPDTPFAQTLDGLTAAMPNAQRRTFDHAGHVPHRSHPAELVDMVRTFLAGLGGVDDGVTGRSAAAGMPTGAG